MRSSSNINFNQLRAAGVGFAILLMACDRSSAPKPATDPTAISSPTNPVSSNTTNVDVNSLLLPPEAEFDIDRASEHFTRGNELLAQEKPREAVAEFELAVKFNPEDEDLFYNLGIAQARAGDNEAARKSYRKALEIYPDYIEVHNNLGNILVAEGKFAEGIEHFQTALKHDDKNANAHNNLGTAYARQNKIAYSLAHFETAIQLQPDYPDAQFNLGNAYLFIGRIDDAINQYTELLRRHPEFQAARAQLQKAQSMKARATSR